jgi:hypothetical protein
MGAYPILKVLVTVLLVVLPLAVLFRDWRFRDQRTRRRHEITRAIVIVWCITSVGSAGLVWHETYQSSRLHAQVDDLVQGKNEILKKNDELLAQNARFQNELAAEREKTRLLELQAKKAERGITSVYDFRGNNRSTSPGRITMYAGGKDGEFRKIVELRNQGRWKELLDECEREMQATPGWLTPYMFAGIAHASLGNREEAVRLLRHVKLNAAGDPEYSEVDALLRKLGAR